LWFIKNFNTTSGISWLILKSFWNRENWLSQKWPPTDRILHHFKST